MENSNLDVLICVHDRSVPKKSIGRYIELLDKNDLPYKDLVRTVDGLTAMQLREEIRLTEPGKITFPRNGVRGPVAIGWITGRGNALTSKQGKLKKAVERYNVKPLTTADLENQFIGQLKAVSDFWGSEENLNQRQAVEGTVYSILSILNGAVNDTNALRYRLAPISNPDNNQRLIEQGKRPGPDTQYLEEDPNLMFTDGTVANDYLVRVRNYGEPLGYGVQ